MVLDEEMSSGRTMPATVSWRTSLLVLISWLPWITMLPLGSTWLTTAAMVTLICSARFTPPVPAEARAVLVVRTLPGSNVLGRIWPMDDSSPRKFGTPMALLVVRLVLVVFWVLAESLTVTSTVRISPTRPARWSLKKVRAPVRHSEFAVTGWGGGSRDDRNSGWVCPTSVAG